MSPASPCCLCWLCIICSGRRTPLCSTQRAVQRALVGWQHAARSAARSAVHDSCVVCFFCSSGGTRKFTPTIANVIVSKKYIHRMGTGKIDFSRVWGHGNIISCPYHIFEPCLQRRLVVFAGCVSSAAAAARRCAARSAQCSALLWVGSTQRAVQRALLSMILVLFAFFVLLGGRENLHPRSQT